ncbi:MAG TPA: hypothetical protein VFM18_15625, partial [Methanosarcina sp.]|nr:hypothetical protein [Methanosarcina sp.]
MAHLVIVNPELYEELCAMQNPASMWRRTLSMTTDRDAKRVMKNLKMVQCDIGLNSFYFYDADKENEVLIFKDDKIDYVDANGEPAELVRMNGKWVDTRIDVRAFYEKYKPVYTSAEDPEP